MVRSSFLRSIGVLFIIIWMALFPLVQQVYARPPERISEIITPEDDDKLTLSLGNRECDLVQLNLGNLLEYETGLLTSSNQAVFQVDQNCTGVLSRLRAPVDGTIWLGLSSPSEDRWLHLDTLRSDPNPPLLDRRGRYVGCKMPEQGEHTCRVSVTLQGRQYQVMIPVRVGVVLKRQSTLQTSSSAPTTSATIPVASASSSGSNIPHAPETPAVETPSAVQTTTGRAINIPGIGFHSGITTLPLDGSGTWNIERQEPLVGHFQGTAWFNQPGNIVLGGHSKHENGSPGIFAGLYNVTVGHEIVLQDGGEQRHYVVNNIQIVDRSDLSVLYPVADRLTLITCDIPSWNASMGYYQRRLVVVAQRVS